MREVGVGRDKAWVERSRLGRYGSEGATMFGRMRKHLGPPVFEDEDRTRTASLLNVILLVIFVASLALTLIAGLISATAPQSLIAGGATAILASVIWLTMRRGHVQLASVLFLFVLLLASIL